MVQCITKRAIKYRYLGNKKLVTSNILFITDHKRILLNFFSIRVWSKRTFAKFLTMSIGRLF